MHGTYSWANHMESSCGNVTRTYINMLNCIRAVNKLKTMIQIEEDKTEIETKIATLENTIKERQKKHLDALYTKERQHDMECQ